MRPKFILIIMVITLAFLLILMISPGIWHSKALGSAVAARFRNPTPENIRALELEKANARREQYIVCSLAVVNLMGIIVFGAIQQRKRTL